MSSALTKSFREYLVQSLPLGGKFGYNKLHRDTFIIMTHFRVELKCSGNSLCSRTGLGTKPSSCIY